MKIEKRRVPKRLLWAMTLVIFLATIFIFKAMLQTNNVNLTKTVHADESIEYIFEDDISGAQYSIFQLKMSDEDGGCCYGIKLPSGKLVMIDSGYQSDYSDIKDFVLEQGGVVDSWFITHPHFDHVGGLIQMFMEEKQAEIDHKEWGITIEKIFFSPFTKEFFTNEEEGKNIQEINKSILFNEFSLFQDERMNSSKRKIEFIPMKTEDIYSVENMSVTCMNSFNNKIYDVNANSLVLHFQIGSTSFLVTGDITDISINEMNTRWEEKNELWDIDIIQIPHHGYIAGITNDSLYKKTTPKIAFLDCSREEYDSNACNIKEHVTWVENLGIDIVKKFSGDNRVVIK